GKITMSDRPRIGSVSGSEREEMRGGDDAEFSGASKMLTNSVSGEVIVTPAFSLDAAEPENPGETSSLRRLALWLFWKAAGVPKARQFAKSRLHKPLSPGSGRNPQAIQARFQTA